VRRIKGKLLRQKTSVFPIGLGVVQDGGSGARRAGRDAAGAGGSAGELAGAFGNL